MDLDCKTGKFIIKLGYDRVILMSDSNKQYKITTLESFLENCDSSSDKGMDELKKLFLSLDKKMCIYHQNNYAITSFRLQDIMVGSCLDDTGNIIYDVGFSKYSDMDSNDNQIIQKNIFYAGCLAVGVYNNCLSYIDPDNPAFLKGNFNLFAENMPTELVPYYRGVIERDATVYLNSFEQMRRKREIEAMQMQAEADSQQEKKTIVSNPKSIKDNEKWGTRESAFVGVSLFPFMIVLLGTILPIIIGLFA